jgi:glucosyl-dolichyl phosphate glucuronosyltransferase
MNISVIVCTYNRSVSLAKALESLAASNLAPTLEWEILVVDNNSKDRTREVVDGFSRMHPERFRYLFESAQGKSHALNTAIRESRGEVLVFVDDDVTVEPNWLNNLTSIFGNAEWAGAGGKILPPPDFSPPRWLALDGPYNMGGVLCAQFDLGNLPGELKEPPYGTNMAFRREVFEKYGTFRTDLGPRPGSELRNEDTEFGRRVLAGGGKLYYAPSAIVYHSIAPERTRKGFFLAWWFAYGRAFKREEGLPTTRVFGIPRYYFTPPSILLRTLLPQLARWLCATDPHERFRLQCTAWLTAGTLVEVLNQIAKGNPSVQKSQPREALQ